MGQRKTSKTSKRSSEGNWEDELRRKRRGVKTTSTERDKEGGHKKASISMVTSNTRETGL